MQPQHTQIFTKPNVVQTPAPHANALLETYENTQQKHTHSKMHSHVWGHTGAHALEDIFSCVGHTRAHALDHTFSRVEAQTCTRTSDRGVHALDTAEHVQRKRIHRRAMQ